MEKQSNNEICEACKAIHIRQHSGLCHRCWLFNEVAKLRQRASILERELETAKP